jgi:hypothetical protein
VLSMDGTGTVFGYLLSALALLIYASLRTSPNRSLTTRTNRALLPFLRCSQPAVCVLCSASGTTGRYTCILCICKIGCLGKGSRLCIARPLPQMRSQD